MPEAILGILLSGVIAILAITVSFLCEQGRRQQAEIDAMIVMLAELAERVDQYWHRAAEADRAIGWIEPAIGDLEDRISTLEGHHD